MNLRSEECLDDEGRRQIQCHQTIEEGTTDHDHTARNQTDQESESAPEPEIHHPPSPPRGSGGNRCTTILPPSNSTQTTYSSGATEPSQIASARCPTERGAAPLVGRGSAVSRPMPRRCITRRSCGQRRCNAPKTRILPRTTSHESKGRRRDQANTMPAPTSPAIEHPARTNSAVRSAAIAPVINSAPSRDQTKRSQPTQEMRA